MSFRYKIVYHRDALFLDTIDKVLEITNDVSTFSCLDTLGYDCITGDVDSNLDGFLVLFF